MSASIGSQDIDARKPSLHGARPSIAGGNAGRAFNGTMMSRPLGIQEVD